MIEKNTDFEKEYVHKFYDQKADVFSKSRTKPWPYTEVFFNKYCKDNTIILDSGCGNGREFFNENVIGLDYSDNLLKEAARKPSVALVRGNVHDLPFKNGIFDTIMSIAVIHHLCTHERRLNCMLEMKRVLKNDGTILVYVWHISASSKKKFNRLNGENEFLVSWRGENDLMRYYYLFDENKLKTLCNEAGFIILEMAVEQESIYAVLKKKDYCDDV